MSAKIVYLPILAVAGHDWDRDLSLSLTNATGANIDPLYGTANLTILDVDPDPAGSLVMIADDADGNLATRDDVGILLLHIQRVGGTQGVQWMTVWCADQDTQLGVDYSLPTIDTVQWADGEGGIKSILLPILPRSQAPPHRSPSMNRSARCRSP